MFEIVYLTEKEGRFDFISPNMWKGENIFYKIHLGDVRVASCYQLKTLLFATNCMTS